jgi:hypothetical protein
MSLLYHSGVDCGNQLRKPDDFNPSGYFESDNVYNIQYATYDFMRQFMPERPRELPDDYTLEPARDKIVGCYDSEFYAIKTPYAICSDLVDDPKKHIFLRRKREDQALSLMRVHTMKASSNEWTRWIRLWEDYILERYKFDLILDFSEFMEYPIHTYNLIYNLGLPKRLKDEEVLAIVKPEQSKFYS